MPTIPSSNGPSVAPGGATLLRAPVDAFGAERPFDTSGADRFIQDIREHEIQRANQIAVTDAGGQMSALETDTLHGPDGALNTQGKDAFTAPDVVAKRWQDGTTKIEEGLTNDTQKAAFRQLAQSHWNAINGQVQAHVAQQRHAYDNSVTDSAVDSELSNAAAAFQDPQRGELAVANTRGLLTNYWRRNGHADGEDGVDIVGQQHIASRISQIRSSVLDQYALAEDDQGASAYFNQHKPEFIGKDLARAEKMVKVGHEQGEGLRAADRILGLGKSPDALPGDAAAQQQQQPAGTLSEALARADQIADPNVRKEAVQSLVSHFTHLEQAKHQDRQAALIDVTRQLETSGGKLNKASKAWQLIDGTAEGEQALHRQDQLLRPPKDLGDPDSFMSHLNMASISPASREEFLRLDFTGKDGDGLNTSQKTRLIDLQRQYRGQDTRADETDAKRDEARKAQAESLRFQRENALLKAVQAHGGIGATLSPDDKKSLDAEVSRIKLHFDQLQAAHGITAPTAPPGLIALGNIDLTNRPRVKNPDGSISTVRSISIEDGGKTILIPTVVGNRVVSNDDAVAHYLKTGEHLGVFANETAATRYAQQLHEQQAQTITHAGGTIDPAHPYDVSGGTLHPIAPIQATPEQLAGAARNPAYAQYLRGVGVQLPKILPKPAEPKK